MHRDEEDSLVSSDTVLHNQTQPFFDSRTICGSMRAWKQIPIEAITQEDLC